MKKSIEQKYKAMSEIDHCLSRPGMWIGSVRDEERQSFVYDDETGKMTMKTVTYVPAMLKLVDEVLSNSCDEFRRKDNMGLDEVRVSINTDKSTITIRDNGGIPVVKHKEAGCYVPEFIFGRLRTSSNYDDTEDRAVVGTNGVGSSLTVIFSKVFKVTTADKKNQLSVTWENNMSEKSEPDISKSNDHFTETSFILDFNRFEQTSGSGLTDDFVNILHKRAIDAAAANPGLTVIWECNGQKDKWKFKKFEEYMELYDDFYDPETVFSMKDDKKQVWVCPGSSIDVAFVNGAECSRGTHLKAVRIPLGKAIAEVLKKKHKIDVTVNNISNKYGIFGIFNISNPAYSSQTKEELTTAEDTFYKDGTKFDIPDDFLKKATKSEIVDIVVDWHKQKTEAEDQAKIRKLNREAKKLLRSDKFINCNSKKVNDKQIWIYEGDSAATGFRASRDPMTQASYRMRGVPLNAEGMTATQIMKNHVFNDIVNILGLQWGDYNKKENLKFGKIILASDSDYDGDKICALLMVFFNHFPELFEQKMVCRVVTPVITATKGKDHRLYYTREDFLKDEKKLKGYVVKWLKGLGTQDNSDYKLMMKDPILHYYTKDDMADMMLKKWFGKGADAAKVRKGMMKDSVSAEE